MITSINMYIIVESERGFHVDPPNDNILVPVTFLFEVSDVNNSKKKNIHIGYIAAKLLECFKFYSRLINAQISNSTHFSPIFIILV